MFGLYVTTSLVFIGSAQAQRDPGLLSEQEEQTSPNTVSLDTLLENAQAGDQAAQFRVGGIYQHGLQGEKNYLEAAKWYRRAGERGFAAAQNAMGFLHFKGLGLRRDPQQAAVWFRAAAEQGFPAAEYNLGSLYLRGDGVSQDFGQAMDWYRQAAPAAEKGG
jgi:TPR repeat protein